MQNLKVRTLEFSSVIKNINLVERFIDEICDEYNINNTYFGNILVSLTESVKNAIIYGNKKNPDKKVKVKFISNSAYLSFFISDEGQGFKISNTYNPDDLYNNNNNNGRGLYLIKKLSDKVKFYNKGSQIELIFYISSINLQLSVYRVKKLNTYFKDKSFPKLNNN